MDINAAVGSDTGWSTAQLLAAVADTIDASMFDEVTLVALAYADAMTLGDVDDELFAAVAGHFDADEIVELTEVIAWENASARFNRALRVGSQHLWHPS